MLTIRKASETDIETLKINDITPGIMYLAIFNKDIIGILLVQPWHDIDNPPMVLTPTTNPNCMVIHDLIIDEQYQRKYIGSTLLKYFLLDVHPLIPITTIARNDSTKFWEHMGFIKVTCIHALLSTINDPTSQYMLLPPMVVS